MSAYRALAVVAYASLWACGGRQAPTPASRAYELHGTVLTSDGQPAIDGVVIVTDLKTTDEVGFTRTDASGRFVVRSTSPQVALTAATTREWYFLSKLDIGSGPLQVQLSRDCAHVDGRIVLDHADTAPRLEILRLARFGQDVGDTFGAIVTRDLRFEACLPPAEYSITLPPEFVKHPMLTMVPAPGAVVIRSASQRAATALPSAPFDLSSRSRDAFVAELPDSVRVLALGESNHGSRELTRERARLAIELARKKALTLIMIEAGYGEVLALDAYIKGANIPLEPELGKLGYWMWNTTTFRDSLKEIRDYNQTASPDRTITICGIDIQTTEGAIDDLTASGSGASDHDRELLARLRHRQGAPRTELSIDDRNSVRHLLTEIAAARDPGGLASVTNRHALSARAVLLNLDLLEQQGFWNQSRARDKAMAELTRVILELEPHVRGTLWVHLVHAVREYVIGAPTLGGHLATSLDRAYRVYVLLANGGSARARDIKNGRRVTAHALPKLPSHSLESVLFAAHRVTRDVTYWSFESAAPVDSHWLQGLHWIQTFGAFYPENNLPLEVFDLTSFDGVILFDSVTPTEPLNDSNHR